MYIFMYMPTQLCMLCVHMCMKDDYSLSVICTASVLRNSPN